MRPCSKRISFLGIVLCTSLGAWAQPAPPAAPAVVPGGTPGWMVSTAPARFAVVVLKNQRPSPLAWTDLCLPDERWASLPMRVFNNAGVAVGSELIWAAPGEPAKLLFDSSSGSDRYYIYMGSDWPALPLKDDQEGVMLESRAGDGKTIDHLPDMLDAWKKSGTILGRTMVPTIFEGGNRFGPQANILEHFRGYFRVAPAEHLELVTMSTDASFVLVDGKEVVEWPGRHDIGPGTRGQFHGAVDLTEGLHVLDYYNAYVSLNEGHPLQLCLAANGGPLEQWTMLTPDTVFFTPSNQADVVDYTLRSGPTTGKQDNAAPPIAVRWSIQDQSTIAPDVANIGLIQLNLFCGATGPGTISWDFGDGTTAQGLHLLHLFPRPGMRTLHLSVTEANGNVYSTSPTINVHPNWAVLTGEPPGPKPDMQTDILARDPATFSASDLASCVAVFETFKNSAALLKLLPAVCAKMKEIQDADLPYIKDAALLLAPDLSHATDTSRLLQELVDRCPAPNLTPPLVAVGSESRLALAQLTLATSDQLDQVRALLDGVNIPSLSGDEHRSLDLLRADIALATGDLPTARKQYEALTGEPTGPDARSSIRRTAQIARARAFLDRKDFEAAEDALGEVARQSPMEKMTPDWALTRLRLYQEEKLPAIALLWAKRLLPVVVENGRSELLFRLTDLAYQQGDATLAAKTLSELLQKHPYSQEAAEAKEKWPGAA
jgi:hypothetical protein